MDSQNNTDITNTTNINTTTTDKPTNTRAIEIKRTCESLPATATEDDQVFLVVRRKKYLRLRIIGRHLAFMFQLPPSNSNSSGDTAGSSPQLNTEPTIDTYPDILDEVQEFEDDICGGGGGKSSLGMKTPIGLGRENPFHDLSIGLMLREYLLLTGRLQEEAFSLRRSLLTRDDLLLKHGFERQARQEYLALRELSLTPRTKAAEKDKKDQEALALSRAKNKKKSPSRHTRRRPSSSQLPPPGMRSPGDSHPGSPSSIPLSRTGSPMSMTMSGSMSPTKGVAVAVKRSKATMSSYGTVIMGMGPDPAFDPGSKSELLTAKLSTALSRQPSISSAGSEYSLLQPESFTYTSSTATALSGTDYDRNGVGNGVGRGRYEAQRDILVESWSPNLFAFAFTEETDPKKFQMLTETKCLNTVETIFPRLMSCLQSLDYRPPKNIMGDKNSRLPPLGYSQWLFTVLLLGTGTGYGNGNGTGSNITNTNTSVNTDNTLLLQGGDNYNNSNNSSNNIRLTRGNSSRNKKSAADVTATDTAMSTVEVRAHNTHLQLERLEVRKDGLLEQIKQSRASLVKVGARAKASARESTIMGHAKDRLAVEVQRLVGEKQKQIKRHQYISSRCSHALKCGDVAEVFDLLGVEPFDKKNKNKPLEKSKSKPSSPGDNSDKLKHAAVDYIAVHDAKLGPMMVQLQALEAQYRRHEADFRSFVYNTNVTSSLITNLAKDRFSTIVDVQDMVLRYTAQKEKLEEEGNKELATLTSLMKYRENILNLISLLMSCNLPQGDKQLLALEPTVNIFPPMLDNINSSTNNSRSGRFPALYNNNNSSNINNHPISRSTSSPLSPDMKRGESRLRSTTSSSSHLHDMNRDRLTSPITDPPEPRAPTLSGDMMGMGMGMGMGMSSMGPLCDQSSSNSLFRSESDSEFMGSVGDMAWTQTQTQTQSEGGLSRRSSSIMMQSGTYGGSGGVTSSSSSNKVATRGVYDGPSEEETEEARIAVFEEYWAAMESYSAVKKKSTTGHEKPTAIGTSVSGSASDSVHSETRGSKQDSTGDMMSVRGGDNGALPNRTARLWQSVAASRDRNRPGSDQDNNNEMEQLSPMSSRSSSFLDDYKNYIDDHNNNNDTAVGGGGHDGGDLSNSHGHDFEVSGVCKTMFPIAFTAHKDRVKDIRSGGDALEYIWKLEGAVIGSHTDHEDLGASLPTTVSPSVSVAHRPNSHPNAIAIANPPMTRPSLSFKALEGWGGGKGGGVFDDTRSERSAEETRSIKTLPSTSVHKGGVRTHSSIIKRREVQPQISRTDPFSAVGLKEIEKLKVNMARSRNRFAVDNGDEDQNNGLSPLRQLAASLEEDTGDGDSDGTSNSGMSSSEKQHSRQSKVMKVRFGIEEELQQARRGSTSMSRSAYRAMVAAEAAEETAANEADAKGIPLAARIKNIVPFLRGNSNRPLPMSMSESGSLSFDDNDDMNVDDDGEGGGRGGIDGMHDDEFDENGTLGAVLSVTVTQSHGQFPSPLQTSFSRRGLLNESTMLQPTIKDSSDAKKKSNSSIFLPLLVEGVNSTFRQLLQKKRERERAERELLLEKEREEKVKEAALRKEEENRLKAELEEKERLASAEHNKALLASIRSPGSRRSSAATNSGSDSDDDGEGGSNDVVRKRTSLPPQFGSGGDVSQTPISLYSATPLSLSMLAMAYRATSASPEYRQSREAERRLVGGRGRKKKSSLSSSTKRKGVLIKSTSDKKSVQSDTPPVPSPVHTPVHNTIPEDILGTGAAAMAMEVEGGGVGGGDVLSGSVKTADEECDGGGEEEGGVEDLGELSYDHLIELIEDEMVHAKFQKTRDDKVIWEDVKENTVSEITDTLMDRCLVDLEKRLKRIRPAKLVRGGQVIRRAELAAKLRKTQERSALMSTLGTPSMEGSMYGGFGMELGLEQASMSMSVGLGLGSQPSYAQMQSMSSMSRRTGTGTSTSTSIDETPPPTTSDPVPDMMAGVSRRDLWGLDRDGHIDMPLVTGSVLKRYPELKLSTPTPITNQAAFDRAVTNAKLREQTETVLAQACRTMLNNGMIDDEDLEQGYNTLRGMGIPPLPPSNSSYRDHMSEPVAGMSSIPPPKTDGGGSDGGLLASACPSPSPHQRSSSYLSTVSLGSEDNNGAPMSWTGMGMGMMGYKEPGRPVSPIIAVLTTPKQQSQSQQKQQQQLQSHSRMTEDEEVDLDVELREELRAMKRQKKKTLQQQQQVQQQQPGLLSVSASTPALPPIHIRSQLKEKNKDKDAKSKGMKRSRYSAGDGSGSAGTGQLLTSESLNVLAVVGGGGGGGGNNNNSNKSKQSATNSRK
eukprot:gene688-1317_t